MNKKAAELLGRAKTAWTRSSPAQRWLVVGLVVVLALAAGVGYYLNRPQWVVLVSQAEPKDAAAIVERLKELKVPYQPTGDGYTIMVPKEEQYTAKLALAQAGLPNGGTVGMELFDQTSFGATEFDKRVNLLRAQQGELERALLRIAEVEYASVKLAMPEESVFVREQQPVTAAVLLETRAGRKLTSQQIDGIIQFVSSSVQGLTPENVKVVDQSGRLLSAGLGDSAGLSAEDYADQLERQRTLQAEVEHRVQTLLEPIFGSGNVVSRVNLELNMDASRVESQTVGGSTPTRTAITQESSSSSGTTGNQPQGDAGAVPIYQGQSGAENGAESWRSTSETDYLVSQRKEVTLIPAGAVKRISVGIAINRPSLSADQIAQIQQTVAGATGADLGAISVVAMAFDQGSEQVASVTGNAPGTFQPMPIAVGAAVALAVLLFGFVLTQRRRHETAAALAAAVAEQAAGLTTGAALNVALGLEGTGTPPQTPSAPEPGAPAEGVAPAAPTEPKPPTARKQLEIVMASKPKRQLIIDGQPIDEALLNSAEDLIQSSPEAAAEVIRQWIKGGP